MSVTKNVTGYNKIIILIPESDRENFDTDNLPERTEVIYVKEYGNGYLMQQLFKMKAWQYCPSDFILFSDSDCIFNRKIDLQEVVKNGKPEILYTDYEDVGAAICWREPTEKFMGEEVEFEFMRRNFLIYHSSTLEKISQAHPDLESEIMGGVRFSEFNAIGAWAFKNEKDKYNFVNTAKWEYTHPLGEQLWGWADKNDKSEIHQNEYARSLKIINETFDLKLTEI